MNRLAKWLVAMALVLSLGGHWALLQGFAWASMLARFSQSLPLTEAVAFTFDGKHPCKMCLAVQQGQQEERKESKIQPVQKLVLILDAQVLTLLPPPAFRPVIADADFIESRFEKPPLPPPRAFFGDLTEVALRGCVRCVLTPMFAALSDLFVRITAQDMDSVFAVIKTSEARAFIGTSPIRRSEVPRLLKTSPACKVTPVNSERTCTNTGASLRRPRHAVALNPNPGQSGGAA